jgi:uncharacterized protein YgiM (DUF1202 family)
MDVNAAGGASFQVWTAAQFSQLAANTGAVPVAASAQDAGDANLMVWSGSFADAGPYYIVVQPTTATTTQYLLNIGGRGLSQATDGGALVAGALNVNIRSGPSTAFSVVRTIAQGTTLTVLGQDASATWLSVRLADGTEGWIARFLTDFGGTVATVATPAQALPPLAPPATDTTLTTGAVVVSGAVNVNVRSGPSTIYSVLRTVPQGTALTVLGQDGTNTWLSVQLSDGSTGWIARYLTNYVGIAPTVAAPVLTQPALAAPQTVINTVPAPVTPAANLYVGPSQLYSVIRTVPQGSTITIIGQDATGAWLSVRLADGTEGWMARAATDFVGTAAIVATPTVSQPVQPPLVPPSTVTVVVPGAVGLPLEPAAVDNFPIESALAANWRTIGQGQTQWFAFSHPGDDQPVQIWMNVDPDNAATFRIFTEDNAQSIMAGANPDDFIDIGRGTPNPNEPADLFWRGAFGENGRFFVMITNTGPGDTSYSIYGVGPGLGS